MPAYELKLASGKVHRMVADSPEAAAARWQDMRRGVVVAWRPSRAPGDSIVAGIDPRRIDG